VYIHDFYKLFAQVCRYKIKPKIHFLLHYPTLIKKYGPMRLEAYHHKIKNVVKMTGNFINVTSTTASRMQRLKCWELSSGPVCPVYNNDASHSTLNSKKLAEMPEYITDFLKKEYCACLHDKLGFVSKLTLNKVDYRVSDVFVVKVENDEPVFLCVAFIFLFQSIWLTAGQILITNHFLRHMQHYELCPSDIWHVRKVEMKVNVQALDRYTHC